MGMISHTIPWQIFQRREISPVSVVCDVVVLVVIVVLVLVLVYIYITLQTA